jgi:hypothetical protein
MRGDFRSPLGVGLGSQADRLPDAVMHLCGTYLRFFRIQDLGSTIRHASDYYTAPYTLYQVQRYRTEISYKMLPTTSPLHQSQTHLDILITFHQKRRHSVVGRLVCFLSVMLLCSTVALNLNLQQTYRFPVSFQ